MKKKLLSLLLALALLPTIPAQAVSLPEDKAAIYEQGVSTKFSGSKPIWVVKSFPDVSTEHWFYSALQDHRKAGIITGDAGHNANLDSQISAAEIYALLVRYVYADEIKGDVYDGAILGDYYYKGNAAWLDAFYTVSDKLADTITKVGHDISVPKGTASRITRKQSFVLYAMAALSRCKDPVWYFGQFSDKYLGYYAKSNAPIVDYQTNAPVLNRFTLLDHFRMTPLEIQCANLLMYLGVLEGTGLGLSPNVTITRAEGIKLLTTIDCMERSPNCSHSSQTQAPSGGVGGDWGGLPGEFPTPPPLPQPDPEPQPDPTTPREYVAVMFYDWDNTLLGATNVPTGVDLRKQVSDYVESHYVHPDLRDGDHSSLSDIDNYRGEFSDTPCDGSKYPLTNHIGYAFVQKPISVVEGMYVTLAVDESAPWAYGWVEVPVRGSNKNDVWTALGVGELADWDGTFFTNSGLLNYTYKHLSEGVTDSIALKALYQPTDDLLIGGNYTPTTDKPYVTLYNELGHKTPLRRDEPSTIMELEEEQDLEYGVRLFNSIIPYYFNQTWQRVQKVNGKYYGVPRARNPHLRADMWVCGGEYWHSSASGDMPFLLDTCGVVTPIYALTDEWKGGLYSPDTMTFAPASTNILCCDGTIVDVWQADITSGVQRSEAFLSDMAHTRQPWLETEETGAIYWSARCGYYRIKPTYETFDHMVERLCMRAGISGLFRTDLWRSMHWDLLAAESYGDPTMFLTVHDVLRLPKQVPAEYYKEHTFSYYNMDPFTQCIWSLTDYICTQHPDTSDNTWWKDQWNTGSALRGTKSVQAQVSYAANTIKYRIPKLSYHQIVLYWNDFYDWYFAGCDPATKPAPMSADAADAIPIPTCTLSAHAGFCHDKVTLVDTTIYHEDELFQDVPPGVV